MNQSDKIRASSPADPETQFRSGQDPEANHNGLDDSDLDELRLQPESRFGCLGFLLILVSLAIGYLVTAWFGFSIGMTHGKGGGSPIWYKKFQFVGMANTPSVNDLFSIPWMVGSSIAVAGVFSLISPPWLPGGVRLFVVLAGLCAIPGIVYGFHKLDTDATLAEGPYVVAYGPLLGVLFGLAVGCVLMVLRWLVGFGRAALKDSGH